MCGIAGAFGDIDSTTVQAVERASLAQVHRGPDGHGLWLSAYGPKQVVLAHRRLAIIDLSEGGHQPMTHSSTGNVICFNGEIYNYRTLREELKSLGHAFQSQSDTEVILAAYAQWGEDCLHKLRGMFAFALWDARMSRVLLARDRLGIKPLYLADAEVEGRAVTLFSSEIRALLATNLIPRELSSQAVHTYLWNGFVQGPQTIIKGITSLDAGSSLWLEAGKKSQSRRYWSLPTCTTKTTDESSLRESLLESVELRLIADVPVGIFLSGGVDSSAIAALASRNAKTPIKTFNVSFEEARFDESKWAQEVAKAVGSEHHEVPLSQGLFQAELDNALASLDQPTFDGINTYFVSNAVRKAGITVALSGAGGDELFGGYTSFRDLPAAQRVSRLTGQLGTKLAELAVRLSQSRRDVPRQTRWGKLADVLATEGGIVPLYQVSYSLFTRSFLERLSVSPLDDTPWGLSPERTHELSQLTAGQPALEALSTLELASFIGERLLRDTDSASMAASLEVRVPLLDHKVVENACRLASNSRYQPLGKKMVLRRAALDRLDPSIFDRPKSGFVLPIEQWARERLQPQITAAFVDERACQRVGLDAGALAKLWQAYQSGVPGIYWSRIWSLYVLLRWCEKYEVALSN
jgi:asparagine synthase (glutamine-hydrolysing)